jgi:hypothetical protein
MNTFWLEDYTILLNKNYIFEVWPHSHYSMERKLNAITRIIIILTILGYYLTKSINIVISSVVTILFLVIIFKNKSKISESFESSIDINDNKNTVKSILKNEFTMPNEKNPLMNVMMGDYKYNNNKKRAAPVNDAIVHEEINKKGKINKDDLKLYSNLGDNLAHEHSMRNFYSMPNTTIPNKQNEFAKFCYGNTAFCKDDNCGKVIKKM